jgi:Phosphotransferase enzyme family
MEAMPDLAPPEFAPDALDAWCRRWLRAGAGEILFTGGHLSRVVGLRLADGREVVVKVRRAAGRLAACAAVQRALWQAGFPCPEPLAGPVPVRLRLAGTRLAGTQPGGTQPGGAQRAGAGPDGEYAASAESMLPGGDVLGVAGDGAESYAGLLARLIRLAPDPATVASLAPSPPWTAWDHGYGGVWPPADDTAADLNAHPETGWLDDLGRRVQYRLRAAAASPAVVGHGDWEAQNLRWRGGQPWAVHDWDSVISAPEPILVGLAAAVWPCGSEPRAASVPESAAFIEAYQRAAGRRWRRDEIQVSWAAGLWVDAFNTKKAGLQGTAWLRADEAAQRLRLAGAD